jgi:hypothetical protein
LDTLTVDIWKWSDSKWTASNIPLFAKVVYTDSKEEILSTSDGRVIVSKYGVATVNLKGLLNVASIEIYVVAPNNKGEYLSNGEVLSFENITIVSDGKDGADGAPGAPGKDGAPGADGKDGVDGTNSIIKGSFDTLDEFKEQIAGADLANRPQDLAFCYIVGGDLYV